MERGELRNANKHYAVSLWLEHHLTSSLLMEVSAAVVTLGNHCAVRVNCHTILLSF